MIPVLAVLLCVVYVYGWYIVGRRIARWMHYSYPPYKKVVSAWVGATCALLWPVGLPLYVLAKVLMHLWFDPPRRLLRGMRGNR